MDTAGSPDNIKRLRAEVEALPLDGGGKRRGISDDLKKRVITALEHSGMELKAFSAAVGLSVSALRSWRDGPSWQRAPGRFKRMKIGLEVGASGESTSSGCFEVNGPQGLRIQRMAMSDLVQLWRSLC
jgi:hypothetical protein